jgi:hypothetical protein
MTKEHALMRVKQAQHLIGQYGKKMYEANEIGDSAAIKRYGKNLEHVVNLKSFFQQYTS